MQEEILPAESALTTDTQEISSLPGLLIEANRITIETISNQRQLYQLTPEITRWQKANLRIFLTIPRAITIIRTQHSHLAQSWAPQHTRKARPKFKSISHDDGRVHQEVL
jgi:hypothetical protein